MLQVELVRAWLDGEAEGSVGSVSVTGDLLFHYRTTIAQRLADGRIILNYTRYSLATGKVQKMITDAIDRDRIAFVSGIEAGYRGPLDVFVNDGNPIKPDDYLMKVTHMRFGEGYVTSVKDKAMSCIFAGQTRTLLYPDVIDSGLVKVVEDRRSMAISEMSGG